MLVASLERVDDAQNFSSVAASASWVREDCTNGLLWIDDEDTADCECNALGVDIGGVLVINPGQVSVSSASANLSANSHVVEKRNLSLLVANDWELQAGATDLVNVLDPASMALNCVCAQADELDTTLGELWLKFGKGAEFCRATTGVSFSCSSSRWQALTLVYNPLDVRKAPPSCRQ